MMAGKRNSYEVENASQAVDEVDYAPNNYVYRWLDACFVICGILTYLVDWGFDMWTAYSHWQHKDVVWFSLTVLFICFPSLVMTAVSLHWYIKDADNPEVPKASLKRWAVRILFLILQLGPLLRYSDTLYYGLLSRRHFKNGNRKRQQELYTYMLYEDSDAVLLRLFECFMEAAPQLVLQLYVLAQGPEYGYIWVYVLSVGCMTSLVSLAWGVTAHARGSRFTDPNKNNISIQGSIVILLWHGFSIGARVIAMVLFATKFKGWLFIVCGAHWFMMVTWLMARRSLVHVCSTRVGEIILSFVLGLVYIFTFINERDEPTKNKYISYYIICSFENILMVALWLVYADSSLWYYIPGVVVHFVSFILGLTMMSVYYGCLHPTKPYTLILREKRKGSRSDAKSIPPEEPKAVAEFPDSVM